MTKLPEKQTSDGPALIAAKAKKMETILSAISFTTRIARDTLNDPLIRETDFCLPLNICIESLEKATKSVRMCLLQLRNEAVFAGAVDQHITAPLSASSASPKRRAGDQGVAPAMFELDQTLGMVDVFDQT